MQVWNVRMKEKKRRRRRLKGKPGARSTATRERGSSKQRWRAWRIQDNYYKWKREYVRASGSLRPGRLCLWQLQTSCLRCLMRWRISEKEFLPRTLIHWQSETLCLQKLPIIIVLNNLNYFNNLHNRLSWYSFMLIAFTLHKLPEMCKMFRVDFVRVTCKSRQVKLISTRTTTWNGIYWRVRNSKQ